MLLETSGSNGVHDEEKLTHFLEASMNNGIIRDGTVTNNSKKISVNELSQYEIIVTLQNYLCRKFGLSVNKLVLPF